MFRLTSSSLELRGIENRKNKDGNVYYILYVETLEGKPYNFYVRDSNIFPDGLKKGDPVELVFDLFIYDGEHRLVLRELHKVFE